jgi:hypothetical protein
VEHDVSESLASSTEQLIQGILLGRVPRQVRLFAAQGLLPVSREELLRLQVLLSSDPDPELSSIASESVLQEDEERLIEWVGSGAAQPVELDLLARLRQAETIWAKVAQQTSASDETLRTLAKNGTPLVQDIIITNQVRILGCLEILDDLRTNPQVSQVVLRRVREFEEEFIAKAVEADGDLPDLEEGLTIEGALGALRSIGANIPAEEQLPVPDRSDKAIEEQVAKMGVSSFSRILDMSIKEKIVCALKGSREERGILINSRNRLVVRAVMASPKLSDLEIERFASSRSVSDEVVRIISANKKWLRRRGVIVALVHNPKTPVQMALRLIPHLHQRELIKLARDRNAHPVVRRQADVRWQQRK